MLDLFLNDPVPEHLIAQEPASPRDSSRLLVLRRSADPTVSFHVFRDLPDLLSPGDLLILNDTRVLLARLLGKRELTGGKWEGLFLGTAPDGAWEMLCQTRGRLYPGDVVAVEPGPLRLTLLRQEEGHWFARPDLLGDPAELLERHGQMPLPPYVRKGRACKEDRERYQTVYARQAGAVAAPTAGLHFTPELFERLEQCGIDRAFVTLHVGLGTFQPIKSTVEAHKMHREWGRLPGETMAAIQECKRRGCRVVAVGTTSVRVLESASGDEWSGETELFIRPPYTFHCVDALVTNFHLPHSTLRLLVAAFAGVGQSRAAYAIAVQKGYRFYSYGDAMLIL
jgi:S-adenosylmethionine:tRNA ribosyltransferase-isomerase